MIIAEVMIKSEWEKVKDQISFDTPSLKEEGFIHCSNINQVCRVADKHYSGVSELLVLCIDTEKLFSEVVLEDLKNTGEDYPHIYGEINTSSIIKVFQLITNNNNQFELTNEIKEFFKKN